MKKIVRGLLVCCVVFIAISFFVSRRPLESAPPTNVKDILSSSQLSYFARIGAGTTAMNSMVYVAPSGNPSIDTNNLFVGDTIGIGRSNGTGLDPYTILDIGNTLMFELGSGTAPALLPLNNALIGNMIVATRSAIHTVYFTPKSSVAGGHWQFLIKASSRAGETPNDGIPDQQGFDIGATTPSSGATGLGTRLQAADVTCPFGTASVGTTAIIGTNVYHVISCDLAVGATNPINVGVTMTIGRSLGSGSQLINPSAGIGHTGASEGIADVYSYILRHTDSVGTTGAVIDADTATGKIAVVESVRVTATVDPTITFYIDSIGTSTPGASLCGTTLSTTANNTTATAVSFGSLNLSAFNNLAQRLSCVTNADGGYSVTVYQTNPMRNINTGTTIPDATCDGACTSSTAAAWNTVNSNSQWGYTMQQSTGNPATFTSTNGWKAFGVGASGAQEIMKNTSTPSTTEQAYICYRVTASTTQEAGNYENHLVFTATATF